MPMAELWAHCMVAAHVLKHTLHIEVEKWQGILKKKRLNKGDIGRHIRDNITRKWTHAYHTVRALWFNRLGGTHTGRIGTVMHIRVLFRHGRVRAVLKH